MSSVFCCSKCARCQRIRTSVATHTTHNHDPDESANTLRAQTAISEKLTRPTKSVSQKRPAERTSPWDFLRRRSRSVAMALHAIQWAPAAIPEKTHMNLEISFAGEGSWICVTMTHNRRPRPVTMTPHGTSVATHTTHNHDQYRSRRVLQLFHVDPPPPTRNPCDAHCCQYLPPPCLTSPCVSHTLACSGMSSVFCCSKCARCQRIRIAAAPSGAQNNPIANGCVFFLKAS